jgi:predicted DNA-binding transcriptional regulator AlpA
MKYANNKTELAKAIGQSRTTLYQIMKLPGFPRPRADGRWPVEEVRKFVLKSAKRAEGPTDRDKMQLRLLDLKIQRASQELVEFEQQLREKITSDFFADFDGATAILCVELRQMPGQLSPLFSGMAPAEIRKHWSERLEEVIAECVAKIEKLAAKPEQTNVVPFDERKAAAA